MYRRQHYTDIVLQIHGRYESRKILRYWGSHDPEMQYFRNIQTVSQRSMCGTHLEQTSGVRQGKRMWLTPASLLMAIQISRVIERSSIWMPSARDVTRNRAITLPFLDASLALSSWPLSRFRVVKRFDVLHPSLSQLRRQVCCVFIPGEWVNRLDFEAA